MNGIVLDFVTAAIVVVFVAAIVLFFVFCYLKE
jgi:hypothetical protein